AHHVEAVAAADRPARDHRDHDLRHEADQPLDLEDVEAPEAGGIDPARGLALGVAVAVLAADPLIAAGAEGPAAVLRRRPVAGEEDAADLGELTRVIQGT